MDDGPLDMATADPLRTDFPTLNGVRLVATGGDPRIDVARCVRPDLRPGGRDAGFTIAAAAHRTATGSPRANAQARLRHPPFARGAGSGYRLVRR
jgi:hypothetical protein